VPALVDELRDIEARATAELDGVSDEAAVEAWRVAYLGRKGRLTLVLRGLASLPVEERRRVGARANRLKGTLEEALEARRQEIVGRQVAAALMLGAQGVWVGSAFLATTEAPIPQWYKDLIIRADDEGTAKSEYWTGKLMRHFKTPLGAAWETSGLKPLPMPLQGILMWDIVAGALEQGKYEHSGQLIGQGIGMTKGIKSARQVVEELVGGAIQALEIGEGAGRA